MQRWRAIRQIGYYERAQARNEKDEDHRDLDVAQGAGKLQGLYGSGTQEMGTICSCTRADADRNAPWGQPAKKCNTKTLELETKALT